MCVSFLEKAAAAADAAAVLPALLLLLSRSRALTI
jgi:hypothetical protein